MQVKKNENVHYYIEINGEEKVKEKAHISEK